jgi:hypothetical protein
VRRRKSAMRRAATLAVLVLTVSLVCVSDVIGGAALLQPTRVQNPGLTATIVMDVTGGVGEPGKGLTSIRIEKNRQSTAAVFESAYVRSFQSGCVGLDLKPTTQSRFIGFMDGWVAPQSVRDALFLPFHVIPNNAAIVSIHDPSCTTVPGGVAGSGGLTTREILSFNAVIRFQK